VYCPHLICGQFVEHCKLTVLQRIQSTSSLHFLKEILAHSLMTLVRDPRLSSGAMVLKHMQRGSCVRLTHLPVRLLSGDGQ